MRSCTGKYKIRLAAVVRSAWFIILLLSGCNTPRQQEARPNILLILTDDQAFNTIRALTNNGIVTPHLDSLVSAGVSFTNTFTMGSWQGAVCTASRTMLLTGKPLWEAQEEGRRLNDIIASDGTWLNHLRKAGYDMYRIGKWDGSIHTDSLFDHNLEGNVSGPRQTSDGYHRPQSPQDTCWTPWDKSFGGYWEGNKHSSEVIAENAAAALVQRAGASTPFFMYLAFSAPHDPRQAPREFVERHPIDKIELPKNHLDTYPYRREIGCGEDARDEQLAPFPRTPYAVRKNIQEYYAIISHLDEQLGMIFQALRRTGALENTVIIFASDNGLAVGQHGLMGKQNMFDHSLRVPLVIAGPGIPANRRQEQLVYLQDIIPTICDFAGIVAPENLYFHSLLPILHDPHEETKYPEVYAAYMNLQRMVRTKQHKLIFYPAVPKVLLYDLEKDPFETKDVSGDPAYCAVRHELIARLKEEQSEVGDTLVLSIPDTPCVAQRK